MNIIYLFDGYDGCLNIVFQSLFITVTLCGELVYIGRNLNDTTEKQIKKRLTN